MIVKWVMIVKTIVQKILTLKKSAVTISSEVSQVPGRDGNVILEQPCAIVVHAGGDERRL